MSTFLPFFRRANGIRTNVSAAAARHRVKQKWRPICVVIENQFRVFEFCPNSLQGSVLRFNPIQIAEWLDDLRCRNDTRTQQALSHELGVSRTRIGQFLSLMRLPEETRRRLRHEAGLTEYHLRRLVFSAGTDWAASCDTTTGMPHDQEPVLSFE